jgi:tol-pal system protein YbgF
MNRYFVALGAAALVSGCATMDEVDQLRNRTTQLETRLAESESRLQSTAEQYQAAQVAMSAEQRAIRETLAALGARHDGVNQRVGILEGRSEDVQSSAGRLNMSAARLAGMEETLVQMQQRLNQLESAATSPTAAAPTGGGSEAALYQKALQAHNQGKIDAARDDFRTLLRQRPDSTYASNALFWIGEGFFTQKKYMEAVQQYMEVIQKHPRSNKVCAATYKAGMALEELKEKQKAGVFYQQVIDQCAASPQAPEAARRKKNL